MRRPIEIAVLLALIQGLCGCAGTPGPEFDNAVGERAERPSYHWDDPAPATPATLRHADTRRGEFLRHESATGAMP